MTSPTELQALLERVELRMTQTRHEDSALVLGALAAILKAMIATQGEKT